MNIEPRPADPTRSIYERAGELDAFHELVERFYAGVEGDEVLRPIYPEDLGPGKIALAEFLAQYWGGPAIYSQKKGHPRLRMRHAGFKVTPEGAARCSHHMVAAIQSMDFPDDVTAVMVEYSTSFAPHMVNTTD